MRKASGVTDAIRDGLKAKGKLSDERLVQVWGPAHLTDAQKTDPTEYTVAIWSSSTRMPRVSTKAHA